MVVSMILLPMVLAACRPEISCSPLQMPDLHLPEEDRHTWVICCLPLTEKSALMESGLLVRMSGT